MNCFLCNKHYNETDGFHCTTYVDVHPGYCWCHFQQNTFDNLIESIAVIPPFIFTWRESLSEKETYNFFCAELFGFDSCDWTKRKTIYEVSGIPSEKFPILINKFSKLKVFA